MFYLVAGTCVPYLRWTQPALRRPCRVWLPFSLAFCALSLALVVAILQQQLVESMVCLACIAAGVPVYFLKRHCRAAHDWALARLPARYAPLPTDVA